MTTNSQQLDFIIILRGKDAKFIREYMADCLGMPYEMLDEYLRDINDTLHGVKLWQLGQEVLLCCDCNQPLTPENKVAPPSYADNVMIVAPWEKICFGCAVNRSKGHSHTILKEGPQYKFENPVQNHVCPECGREDSARVTIGHFKICPANEVHDVPVEMVKIEKDECA